MPIQGSSDTSPTGRFRPRSSYLPVARNRASAAISLPSASRTSPLALAALIALPVIWFVLRATPPAPRNQDLPSLHLLDDVKPREETPDRTPWWVLLLRIPYQKLYPMIVVMICVGVYSHRTSVTDVLLTLAFGILGYLMKNYRFEPAPVLLGFVLGPLLEDNFRRTMLLYGGDFTIFLTRPISAVLVACSIFLIGFAIWSSLPNRRNSARSVP